jgi:transcriptional regulator with XRE-family HTH domain
MWMENKKMELLEKIRLALADRKLDKVAAQTGLHENTVRAIASGKNTNPTLATVEKLAAYLFGDKHEVS